MKTHSEAAPDGLHHALVAFGRGRGTPLLHEVEHLVATLVGPSGATPTGEQPREPVAAKCGLGLVERLTTDAKGGSYLGDWSPLEAVAT